MEATIKFPVLPGDSVFMLDDKKKIIKYVVDKISVLKDGSYITHIYSSGVPTSTRQYYDAICPTEFGNTVFLTMEDAIDSLRSMARASETLQELGGIYIQTWLEKHPEDKELKPEELAKKMIEEKR